MGALAPVTSWIPQDDLLLKNAVEAGASLESLAKGAVCFSRQFTFRELQDRWHSLLYDSDISEEASAQIVKIESSVSKLLKSNKSCNSKQKEWMPTKRKADSVRSHYYAKRKRIFNEPFHSFDLDFLGLHDAHIFAANGGNCQEQLVLNNEHSNGYAHQEASLGIVHHASPQMMRVDTNVATDVDVSDHTIRNEHPHSLVHNLPNDGAMVRESLYGFVENVTLITNDKSIGKNVDGHSFNHNNLYKNIPEIFGEIQCRSGVEEMEPPQTLSFEMVHNNQANACSSFGGNNQNFSSPISNCSASCHQLEYSCSQPSLPIWRTIDDITAPAMEIEESLEDKVRCVRSNLMLSAVDDEKTNPQGCNVVPSDSKLIDGMSGDGLNGSSAISEGDFVDLSNPLFDFANAEQFLLMDDDEDMIDRSCLDGLNSILLSSPYDVHQDEANSCDPKTSTVLDTGLVIPDGACPGELNDIGGPLDIIHDEDPDTCGLELNMPATSQNCSLKSEELMCCTLNTEDPEIPCNDDICPSTEVLSSCVSSVKEFCARQRASEQEPALKEEEEAPLMHHGASLMLPYPEFGSKHPNDDHEIKPYLFENDSAAVAFTHAGIAGEDPSTCTVVPVTVHNVPTIKLNEDIMGVESVKHDSFDSCLDSLLEKSVQGVDHRSLSWNIVNDCKPEVDELVALKKHAPSHEELSFGETGFSEPITNLSDHGEFLCESNDDVPYFSDIEGMILDMDLVPYDQESYFAREVSRYQDVKTKKAILRLEQGVHSYIQRALASRGAFAVFYGRRLKHYIKKTEVSLGRATVDVNVDIDLAKEGHANKISRRQAIIKMEEDGSVYLKNLGKCSISVNSKEVATGQCFNLTSCCLIKIRSLNFIFEMNQSFVSKCTTIIAKRKCTLDKNAKIDKAQ